MTMAPTKTAARKFYRLLKDAEEAPVIISRHGKARAVLVSIRRFRLYEKVLAHVSEDAAAASLRAALENAREGRLGIASRALKKAAELGAERPSNPGKSGR